MDEFTLIRQILRPLAEGRKSAQAYANDTANIDVPKGTQLVTTTDMLVEGVHFFPGTPPEIIAQKALRTNISDCVSSGARPVSYQLALGLSDKVTAERTWLPRFVDALRADHQDTGLFCSGGDTTRSPSGVVVSMTIMGALQPGEHPVTRSGAEEGDVLLLSGRLGEGKKAYAQERTVAPPLQHRLAPIIQTYAKAAIDISDGVLADLGHMAGASLVGLALNEAEIPVVEGVDRMQALTFGDDYQLAFCVAPKDLSACQQALLSVAEQGHVIGKCTHAVNALILRDTNGSPIPLPNKQGWSHF